MNHPPPVVKLRCPQPTCEGVLEPSYPELPEDWDVRRTVGGVRPSWRCPKCDIRILVSNPNVLEKNTEYRVHRATKRHLRKYTDAGSGLWIPKDV